MLGVRVRGQADWELWLLASSSGQVSVTNYEFAVDALGTVFKPSRFAGQGSFSGELRF
jgi:hypothetical protein